MVDRGHYLWKKGTALVPTWTAFSVIRLLEDNFDKLVDYQFTADVVAVGPNGRGYCRTRTVFDMTRSTPRIVYHQDLSSYGWALGAQVRQLMRAGRSDRL